MNVELPVELKRELVRDAERIAKTAADEARKGRPPSAKGDKKEGGAKKPGGDKRSGGDSQVSQLRNLLQITQRETEVPVLVNFIRYQAARKATWKFWKPIHEDVIGVLTKLEGESAKRPAPEAAAFLRVAVQSFLGYLIRAYVYESVAAGGAEPQEDAA
jgi:hypothetical protein